MSFCCQCYSSVDEGNYINCYDCPNLICFDCEKYILASHIVCDFCYHEIKCGCNDMTHKYLIGTLFNNYIPHIINNIAQFI